MTGKSTRRSFLKAGVGGAVGVGLIAGEAAASKPGLLSAGLRRPRYRDDILFLVHRITQGFSQPTYLLAKQMGYGPFLEWQLLPDAIPDPQVDQFLTQFPSLPMSYRELYEQYTQTGQVAIPRYEMKAATIYRSIFSERQLFEHMVEFWSDHFSIYHDKDGLQTLKTVDDREVIRKYALATFPEMLVASAHSGAMLVYLDNQLNVVGYPNENYARELLELHTLGVDGGYTEADVKEVARCLTGWTIDTGLDYGQFRYDDSLHDQGAKTVLGHPIPPGGGQSDGDTVLQILAQHPSTAKFIARKMCRWLYDYDPSDGLVNQVAATYLATGGDIKAMIRVVLDPFRAKPADVFDRVKFRRPRHFVISLLRATQASVTDVSGLLSALDSLNHSPFGWVSPDGYPDRISAWQDSLLPRWSFASELLNKHIAGTIVKWSKIQELLGNAILDSEIARGVNRILAGGMMAQEDEVELQTYVNSFLTKEWAAIRQVIAVGASCASLQYF